MGTGDNHIFGICEMLYFTLFVQPLPTSVSKQKEKCPTDNCEAFFGGLKRIRSKDFMSAARRDTL